ncbi:hypothetical protein PspLS_07361 [Pyricularia sp. CBS 133598]|nr:hypothetical protein PspLS_07361 [Pyricularia sp. CBS 133598]
MPTIASTSAAPPAPLLSAPPPGPGLRRSANGNGNGHGTNGTNGGPHRRRSNIGTAGEPPPENGNGFDHHRRRYSNVSSDPDTFDIRSLGADFPPDTFDKPVRQQLLNWQSVPLVLALLPAIAGLLFKNGSDFVTDALLLALAAVILHAAITKPWTWYQLAQEIRLVDQVPDVVHDSSDQDDEISCGEDGESMDDEYSFKPRTRARLGKRRKTSPGTPKLTERQKKAMAELRLHENFALVSCFAFPVLGAILLHVIRSHLSRPSEGLVSDYNLAIFILAAEIRPVRHLLHLFESRTWHMQRIVASNPFLEREPQSIALQLDHLSERIDQLETRAAADDTDAVSEATSQRREAILRDAKIQIQPEVKALYRTVRQFEKKYIVLAVQVDNRLHLLDRRIEDAITVAAHAAKSCRPRPSLLRTTSEQTLGLLFLPVQITKSLLSLPFRLLGTAVGLFFRQPRKANRGYHSGRSSRSSSACGDRSSRASSRR